MSARTQARAWTFGRSADAELRLADVEVDDLGRASFTLVQGERSEQVSLQLLGEHQALNAAATAATSLAAGLSLEEIATSLRTVDRLSPWRMELHERSDGLAIVNDAYNANPDSMRAALETLARMGGSGRRTVAVLGEMRELGGDAEEEHRRLGLLADRLGIDVVVVVGPGAQGVHDALVERRGHDERTRHVDTTTQAGDWLRENVAGPDVVLIKASRGGRLERVAQMLVEEPTEQQPAEPRGEEPVR